MMQLLKYSLPLILSIVQSHCEQQKFTYHASKNCDKDSLSAELAFETVADNAIACVRLCSGHVECGGTIFYEENNTCVGVKKKNDDHGSDHCAPPGATHYKLASTTAASTAATAGLSDTGPATSSGSTFIPTLAAEYTTVTASPATASPGCVNTAALLDLDSQFSASSSYGFNYRPIAVQLGSSYCWVPARYTAEEYIQVRFITPKVLTEVATIGYSSTGTSITWGWLGSTSSRGWVRSYTVAISISSHCSGFVDLTNGNGTVTVFVGNSDESTLVTNSITPPVVAHCVRIHPVQWSTRISLKLELYGCDSD